MLKVMAHGDAFRLVDASEVDVGWIRAKAIGFRGFTSEETAFAAALDGARLLARCLQREYGVRHPALSDAPRLRKVNDGAYDWIADGSVPIARLLRVDRNGRGEQFAIEFVLPSYVSDAIAINAAQLIHRSSGERTRGGAARASILRGSMAR